MGRNPYWGEGQIRLEVCVHGQVGRQQQAAWSEGGCCSRPHSPDPPSRPLLPTLQEEGLCLPQWLPPLNPPLWAPARPPLWGFSSFRHEGPASSGERHQNCLLQMLVDPSGLTRTLGSWRIWGGPPEHNSSLYGRQQRAKVKSSKQWGWVGSPSGSKSRSWKRWGIGHAIPGSVFS